MFDYHCMCKHLCIITFIFTSDVTIVLKTSIFLLVFVFKKTNYSTNPDIHINISRNTWDDETSLRILVLTFNRPMSLQRLLHSLDKAYYYNDKVVLEIWIDKSSDGVIDKQTFTDAVNFKFNKGSKYVYTQTRHVGIYGQWMGTWRPNYQSEEITVIFEDDITVSPWFYRYLKLVHKQYSECEKINGFSMEQNMKHGSEHGKLNVSNNNIVFLYPVIGTSGFSPKKHNWIKFLKWYDVVRSKQDFFPLVPEIKKPTQWYTEFIKKGKTDTMWEMWHIYFAYHNKEWTLYPNFGSNLALTINWKEKGLHFDGSSQKDTTKLVKIWDNRFNSLPKHPIFINTNGIQEY